MSQTAYQEPETYTECSDMRHQTVIVFLSLFSIGLSPTVELISAHSTQHLRTLNANYIEFKGTKQEDQYTKPSTHRGETRRDKERGSGRIGSKPSSNPVKSKILNS